MKPPEEEVNQIALVKRPNPTQWIDIIERDPKRDEGVRVWHNGRNHWYRWSKIKRARWKKQ